MLLKSSILLSDKLKKQIDQWIKERVQDKKPLQYILGSLPFCDINVTLRRPILIPRPETEYWTSWLIDRFSLIKKEQLDILDMGCGSGCIALALAKSLPNAHVIGIDKNEKAIELSQENKRKNNINNAHFFVDTFDLHHKKTIHKTFDLIVSNPPYIDPANWQTLSDTVKNWEDKDALVAPQKGLSAFEIIIKTAKKHLKKNCLIETNKLPQLVLEIGIGQEEKVRKLLFENGFKKVEFFRDLRGIYRWVTA